MELDPVPESEDGKRLILLASSVEVYEKKEYPSKTVEQCKREETLELMDSLVNLDSYSAPEAIVGFATKIQKWYIDNEDELFEYRKNKYGQKEVGHNGK